MIWSVRFQFVDLSLSEGIDYLDSKETVGRFEPHEPKPLRNVDQNQKRKLDFRATGFKTTAAPDVKLPHYH
jgi:hypothetical protein